jgi:hypothetical protein
MSADRGPVLICFQASISRQFEVIQAQRVDDGDPFGLGPGPPAALPQAAHGHEAGLGRGEYLYRPSMTALRMLADGSV